MKNNDVSGDKNKSLQKNNKISASWAEKSTHSPRNSTGSHPVTPRTMKTTARKSTGRPRTDWKSTTEEGMIEDICEQSGDNTESLQTSGREMPSAEDRDSCGDKNVSLPRDNEVRASQAEKSTCSRQNSARNRLVTSRAIKNTARKSTGGSGTEWKSIAEKNMIGNHIREKSVPQNITGRHQKIIEVQFDKELEKILGPNGDTEEYECSSEEDNSFYTKIHNIISDKNLFGAEDSTDSGQAERSIASVSNIAICRSESESPLSDLLVPTGKRTAATRPSRMDLHYKNPRSSKKRGHSDEDLEHGFEMTLNIPKKHREAKEASRIKATMSEQLKGCSVDIRRLSMGELVGKTTDRNDEQESDDDIMDSEEENKEPPRISRKTMQSRASKTELVGKTTDRNDEQESDDDIMDSEEENKEPPRISRRTMQSRASKRKAVASQSSENKKQEDSCSDGSVRSISVEAVRKKRGKAVASQFSEDESHVSNKGSSRDDSESSSDDSHNSSSSKHITKKSAPPTQHRKRRPMRKSAITAKKLSSGKAERVDKTTGRNDDEERDDGDMDSEEGNKENTHIYRKTIQSRASKTERVDKTTGRNDEEERDDGDMDSEEGNKENTHIYRKTIQSRASKRKTFASQSLEDEGHISNRQKGSSDDSDSSSGVKPITKKSAAPVQHRKARHVRHSALVAKKLLRKVEHSNESSDESDEEKSDHDISHLGRETAEGCSSSEHNVSRQCFIKLRRLPIDPTPKSILLTASFLKDLSPVSGGYSSVNKKKEEDDSDWQSSNGASSSSSSISRSSRCSENSSDDLTSGSDENYELSESDAEVNGVVSVSSVSSGSDFDYEVPTSEEEKEELRISAGTRSGTRMKLRKSVRMRSSMKPSVSDSHHAPRHSPSSDDDRSGHNASSSDDDRPDPHASKRLSSSDEDRPGRDAPATPGRGRGQPRKIGTRDVAKPLEKAPAIPGQGRCRPRKIGTPDVAKPLEKAPTTPGRGRGRPRKIGTPDVAKPLEKDSSHSSSLNNSDVENMNSDTLTPSRKRNLQKRSLTSSAYDDDALRSIFNIYPCEVVCRKITFNPSYFNFYGT